MSICLVRNVRASAILLSYQNGTKFKWIYNEKNASPKWANKLLRRRIIKYANVVRALSFQLSNFVQLTHFIYFSYFCFKQTIKTAYSSLLPILHACMRYPLCEQSIFAFVDLFGSSVKPFLRVNRIVQQTIGSTAAAAIHCHLSVSFLETDLCVACACAPTHLLCAAIFASSASFHFQSSALLLLLPNEMKAK